MTPVPLQLLLCSRRWLGKSPPAGDGRGSAATNAGAVGGAQGVLDPGSDSLIRREGPGKSLQIGSCSSGQGQDCRSIAVPLAIDPNPESWSRPGVIFLIENGKITPCGRVDIRISRSPWHCSRRSTGPRSVRSAGSWGSASRPSIAGRRSSAGWHPARSRS
jgi:hypothetical protein